MVFEGGGGGRGGDWVRGGKGRLERRGMLRREFFFWVMLTNYDMPRLDYGRTT